MNNDTTLFIGLDTHKSFTQVALLKDNRGETPISYGRIDTSKSALIKLAQKIQSQFPKATLHFIYEAGPSCGYWIYRLLTSLGYHCYIVAPRSFLKNLVIE